MTVYQSPKAQELIYPEPSPKTGSLPITHPSSVAILAPKAQLPFRGWITGTALRRWIRGSDGRMVSEMWFAISYDLRMTGPRGERPFYGSEWVANLESVSI